MNYHFRTYYNVSSYRFKLTFLEDNVYSNLKDKYKQITVAVNDKIEYFLHDDYIKL